MTVPTFDSKAELKAFIERVERLEEEKKAISDDIRDIYAEAKGRGFDTKALKAIVKLRKLDAEERREQEAILDTYMHALGMANAPAQAAPREHAEGAPSTFTKIGDAVDTYGLSPPPRARRVAVASPPREEEPHDMKAKPSGHQGGAAFVAASSSEEDLDIPACLDRRGGGALRC